MDQVENTFQSKAIGISTTLLFRIKQTNFPTKKMTKRVTRWTGDLIYNSRRSSQQIPTRAHVVILLQDIDNW